MIDPTELLARVDAHLTETGIPPSTFGMKAVGDPNFVRNLRAGREPRSRVVARVIAFMDATKGQRQSEPRASHEPQVAA